MITVAGIPATRKHPEDVLANITLSHAQGAKTPWVTHFQNLEDALRSGHKSGGKSNGHYFDNLPEALVDLGDRVARGY